MTTREEMETAERSGRHGVQSIAPAVAPVMYFRHPVAGFSGPPVPFLALRPPPTSAVVLSLLDSFTVGAVAPSSSTAEDVRKRVEDASKRRRSGEDQCGPRGAIGDSSDAEALKRKKYTYVARRVSHTAMETALTMTLMTTVTVCVQEERDQLEREIAELEERARQLREACAGKPAGVNVVSLENARMREAVSEQQHVLARVQSVMTEFAVRAVLGDCSLLLHAQSSWHLFALPEWTVDSAA